MMDGKGPPVPTLDLTGLLKLGLVGLEGPKLDFLGEAGESLLGLIDGLNEDFGGFPRTNGFCCVGGLKGVLV